MKIASHETAAYYAAVLDSLPEPQAGQQNYRAECPFHPDNGKRFTFNPQNGDYDCSCGYGSIVEFEIRRSQLQGSSDPWRIAAKNILTIVSRQAGQTIV